MADSVRITIEADDKTAAGIASAVTNIGKIEKAASAASGKASGIGGTGAAGLSNAFGGLNNALRGIGLPAIGFTAVLGGIAAFTKSAIITSQQYTTSVMTQSKASGQNAEQSSRLIQVLDDYKITAQDALIATKALTREGYAPTVETLAKLSDQYLKLNSAEEQNAFVLKNLGKGGLEWLNFLSQGSTAIMQMNDNVDKNLILSDRQLAMSEKERLAFDAVSDSWEGIKIQSGLAIGELIVAQDELNKKGELVKQTQMDIWKEGGRVTGSYEQWTAAMLKSGQATDKTLPGLVEYKKAMFDAGTEVMRLRSAEQFRAGERDAGAARPVGEGATMDFAGLLKNGVALTKIQESFTESQEKIHKAFDDNATVAELFKGRVAELKDELKDGDITNQEYYASVVQLQNGFKDGSFAANEQKTALAELETVQDKQGAAFLSSLLEQSEASDELKLKFAEASGQITKEAADQFRAFDKVADALNSGKINAEQAARAVKAVAGDVSALNGMTAEAFVDLFITTHGGASGIVQGLTGLGRDGSLIERGKHKEFASGSQSVPYGTIAEVGEEGREGLIVNRNGTVSIVPARTWADMKKYGVSASAGFAMGTSDPGPSISARLAGKPRSSSQTGRWLNASVGRGSSQSAQEAQEEIGGLSSAVSGLKQAVEQMQKGKTETMATAAMVEFSPAASRRLAEEIASRLARLVG